jgi:hypothetical protein
MVFEFLLLTDKRSLIKRGFRLALDLILLVPPYVSRTVFLDKILFYGPVIMSGIIIVALTGPLFLSFFCDNFDIKSSFILLPDYKDDKSAGL